MIHRCFFHQHPEDFDRPYIDEAWIPAATRYWRDEIPASTAVIPEEAMGYPDAGA